MEKKIEKEGEEEKEIKKKLETRCLRTRIFCIGLGSEKKLIRSWMLNLRLFPENVCSCPSDRAVSQRVAESTAEERNSPLQSMVELQDAHTAFSSASPRPRQLTSPPPAAQLGSRARSISLFHFLQAEP